MESLNSVCAEKARLRREAIAAKMQLSAEKKLEYDSIIAKKLINSEKFQKSETIFTYYSMKNEISTVSIIEQAWLNGKKVALPYCYPDENKMDFFYINSFNGLIKSSFGVFQPPLNSLLKADNFRNSLCVVPALMADKSCGRLGYGKGYYDRFLSVYNGFSATLCYSFLLKGLLPSDEYDMKTDMVITQESDIYNVK